VKESGSLEGHRAAAADGSKPGKSLKRKPVEAGSKDDYDSVMAILEANYGNANVSERVLLLLENNVIVE
jgi:hypothetical protein